MHKIRTFHQGHSTAGEWQGSGRVVGGERHGMCESALNVQSVHNQQQSLRVIK
jgi:hypothetical protein